MTHSLKVAQIARRIGEWLRDEHTQDWPESAQPHPEAAAAAGLAHDLGHPPYGHVAEASLRELVEASGDADGFEGNAQSFRIVTRLAAHRPGYPGLDLTPRTLNAILKYPWLRATTGKRSKKFGVYRCDSAVLDQIRTHGDDSLSIDAQIMDRADEITYAVHDLYDFWRAGLIPVDRLRDSDQAFDQFIDDWVAECPERLTPEDITSRKDSLRDRLRLFFPETFGGSFHAEAVQIRTVAVLIGNQVRAIRLSGSTEDPLIEVDRDYEVELKFLQRLTWQYVISNPRLATQQTGQRRVIKELFSYFLEAAEKEDMARLPARLAHLTGDEHNCSPARLAADSVASLADSEATRLYLRISGISSGSVLDHL